MAEPSKVFYGCIGGVGHYWWPYKERRSLYRPSSLPWERVDGALTPTTTTKQGTARLHHKDGWTALAVHDYSVDRRPGSNSNFFIHADLDLDEMLFSIVEFWPEVAGRIGEITVVAE